MTTKNILIVSAIAIVAAGFVVKDEIERLKQLFLQFRIKPVAIRNFSAKFNDFKPFVSFNMDLNFYNPTFQNFVVNGTIVTIKKILFYDENSNLLGVSDVNIKSLQVDANTGTVIPNIPITLSIGTLIGAAATMVANGFNVDTLRTEMIVSVLGLEYKIG